MSEDGVHKRLDIVAGGRVAVQINRAGRLQDGFHLQETLRHIRQIGQQTRLRVTQGVKPQFPQLRRRIVNAGITHQHGHVLDGTLAFRVHRSQNASIWSGSARPVSSL